MYKHANELRSARQWKKLVQRVNKFPEYAKIESVEKFILPMPLILRSPWMTMTSHNYQSSRKICFPLLPGCAFFAQVFPFLHVSKVAKFFSFRCKN